MVVFPPSNHMLSSSSKYLVELEQHSGTKVIPGHDPKIKPIRVTLDPVRTAHKPLIWYLVSTCLSDKTSAAPLTIRSAACRCYRHVFFSGPIPTRFQTPQPRKHLSCIPSTTVHHVFRPFARSPAVLVPPTPFDDEDPCLIPAWYRGTFVFSST